MEASFLARGWEVVENHKDADMIVVRGCSVTARAQRDCEKLIEHIRMRYPNKRLVVTGCLKEKRNEHWLADLAPATPERTARAYLKVQDGCACNCTFCIVPQFRGKPVSRDLDGVLDDAKRFIDAGYREIVVTGCNLSCYSSCGTSLAGLVFRHRHRNILDARHWLDGTKAYAARTVQRGKSGNESGKRRAAG